MLNLMATDGSTTFDDKQKDVLLNVLDEWLRDKEASFQISSSREFQVHYLWTCQLFYKLLGRDFIGRYNEKYTLGGKIAENYRGYTGYPKDILNESS